MSNHINKYLNQSAYDADDTKQYPNVSYISGSDEVVFKMQADPEPVAFGGLTVKYDIDTTLSEVTLFNIGGDSSSSGSSSSESGSGSGGGGALPTTMIVDGNEETPINTWRFETTGEHIVQYEFEDNIIPGGFLDATVATATEAIIGDDITEISFNSGTGNGAFQGSLITTVTIGTGIYAIGESAFAYSSLETLTVKAFDPPVLGTNVFYDSSITAIYVPASVVEYYKQSTSTGWYQYASLIQAIS